MKPQKIQIVHNRHYQTQKVWPTATGGHISQVTTPSHTMEVRHCWVFQLSLDLIWHAKWNGSQKPKTVTPWLSHHTAMPHLKKELEFKLATKLVVDLLTGESRRIVVTGDLMFFRSQTFTIRSSLPDTRLSPPANTAVVTGLTNAMNKNSQRMWWTLLVTYWKLPSTHDTA